MVSPVQIRLLRAQTGILADVAATKTLRTFQPGQILCSEHETPSGILVVLKGWIEQALQLPDGRRQIVGLAIQGDMCNLGSVASRPADCALTALTEVAVGEIGTSELQEALLLRQEFATPFWAGHLRILAIQRRWIAMLGQRNALERISHLFCELFVRQQMAGFCNDTTCPFPLTQTQIAEACGLTQVHTNRTLQELRKRGLVDLNQKQLRIPHFDELAALAVFEGSYLRSEYPPTRSPSHGLAAGHTSP